VAEKSKSDGIIVKREADGEGYVYGYDKNDRSCWGSPEPERIVLLHDLRAYAPGLHIGQLGWTIPGTMDGYKWIDVQFDNGARIPVSVYGIERVLPDRAQEISAGLIEKNRNTRFDANPEVAERCRREWIRKTYEAFVSTDQMTELGVGDQELHAFTFPSLQELAKLKQETHCPVKVGYTGNKDAGAVERIRSQIFEAAAFPERPRALVVCRTWDGRALETAVQNRLREQGRQITTAPGIEWFMTNAGEILAMCEEIHGTIPKPPLKPLSGASPTMPEALGDGVVMEEVDYPGSASVGLRIVRKEEESQS
jgi:hypothetical protein